MPSRARCVHCGKMRQVHSYRVRQSQLCRACWIHPELKAKYPPVFNPATAESESVTDEERAAEEAEVERVVAEQMKVLPSWWAEDTRKKRLGETEDVGRRVAGALRFTITRGKF